VPVILDLLRRVRARATFFVSFGPDASGLALLQMLNPRFAIKMMRTRAGSIYGWKTALYGTLLPAPLVGADSQDLIRRIHQEGHEVGMHGWDHRRWQDWLPVLSTERLRAEFARMMKAYRETLDHAPPSFASPAWRLSRTLFDLTQGAGLLYGSDSRGTSPFLPVYEGRVGSVPQYPVTLPTLDEGLGRMSAERFFERLLVLADAQPQYACYTAHADGEGDAFAPLLEDFLLRVDRPVGPLGEASAERLMRHELRSGHVDGRPSSVTIQGPVSSGAWEVRS
jgi:peptidoglycan/xylan/chitin deacetylase (PgdA/CDA1 family)